MRERRRHPNCLNCGQPTPGEFCGSCGQRNADLHASFWQLSTDLVGEAFEADSRIGRTVLPFVFRPGFLTNEHNAGRRVRYSSPLRLYLFCSFAYFLALSLTEAAAPAIRADAQGGVRISYGSDGPGKDHASRVPDQDPLPAAGAADGGVASDRGLGSVQRRIEQRAREVTTMDPSSRSQFKHRLQGEFINTLPKVIFVLLPLSALLLKLFFWRTRRFYVEHLTFAFHLHALAFFVLLLQLGVLTVTGPLPAVSAVAFLLIALYLLVALRTVYGQAWGWIVLKFVGFTLIYALLIAVGIGAAAVIGLLSA